MVDAMAGNKIYVQGSYIDIHDNENVYLSVDKAKVNVSTGGQNEVPSVLAESELWERLKDEGLVDENGMPTVSRPEAALMADMLATRLNISNKWKMFERLWNRKNMRNDYNTALGQRKSLDFQEKLKNILY